MRATPKKKHDVESYAGPRILVVLDPAAVGARGVDLACLAGREAHAEIHLACALRHDPGVRKNVLERAAQLARLHHLKVAVVEGFEQDSAGSTLRLARRLRPIVLVVSTARPGTGWNGVVGQMALWSILKRSTCEVVIVRG